MRDSNTTRNDGENGMLLALTLACYLAAVACVFAIGHTLVTLAARDAGRRATVAVAPFGL